MPFRVGTNRIKSNILGSNTMGQAYLGYKSVYGGKPDNVPTSGGDIQIKDGYVIQTFTSLDTLVVDATINDVDILLIAGGGAGGQGATVSGCGTRVGGGGGAGGMIYITGSTLTADSYPITIGAGGIGSTGSVGEYTENGEDSTFNGLTAFGGGGGGRRNTISSGSNGGSGGGGVYAENYSPEFQAGGLTLQTGSGGFGNDGADSFGSIVCGPYPSTSTSGGGGGAGGGTTTEVGGIGKTISITGTAIEYAKGGYGGGESPTTTARNYGDGGHGFYWPNAQNGDGGNGILIIRYPL